MSVGPVLHNLDAPGALSPFEAALARVREDGVADIVCPYIGFNVLEWYLSRLDRWRLLTDVEAWMSITQKREGREAVSQWCQDHVHNVRHIAMLHAKVIIGQRRALIMSANLTDAGMLSRLEAGVLVDEPAQVSELQNWFGQCWGSAVAPDALPWEWLVRSVPQNTPPTDACCRPASLHRNPVRVRSMRLRLREMPRVAQSTEDLRIGDHDEMRLIGRLERTPSRAWASAFLDWTADLLKTHRLTPSDRRLMVSLTKAGKLNISVNNRYALATGSMRDGCVHLMISRRDTRRLAKLVPGAIIAEEYFDGGRSPRTFAVIPFPPAPSVVAQVMAIWHAAIKDELTDRSNASGRRVDTPSLCLAATSQEYRDAILDAAFPSETSSVSR